MWTTSPKLPFKLAQLKKFSSPEEKKGQEEAEWRYSEYISEIKKQAIENQNIESEILRIMWSHRFKKPMHDHFDEYTPEEMLLETWEQYYYENPDHLELKGISKRIDPNTGYKYYETGDPMIDEMERSFGRGEIPDFKKAFGHIKEGRDIFRSPVFSHEEHTVFGERPGEVIAPRKGYEGVQENEKGEKIDSAGAKIEHTDFTIDDWVQDALENDPVLAGMQKKMEALNAE